MALILLSTACTNENSNDLADSKVTADKVAFYVQAPTRAGETTFDTGDAISVFASTATNGVLNTTGNYADNAKYAYVSDGFIHTGTGINVPNMPGNTVAYYAVYPFMEQLTPQFSFTVNTDQSTYDAYTKSDLMLASVNTSAMTQTVPLKFDHVMSRLLIDATDLRLNWGTYSLELLCYDSSVNVNLQNQSVQSVSDFKRIKVCADGAHHFKVILPPQLLKLGNVVASLQIDGQGPAKSVTMYSPVELKAGTSVELKLRKKEDTYYFY